MPELRRDPIVDRWVIIAENRAERPGAFAAGAPLASASNSDAPIGPCPFCPGNEHDTPLATYALRDDGGNANEPGWRVRIVPNKYPALNGTEAVASLSAPVQSSLFMCQPAEGIHEVIIDTPRHIVTVGELNDAELADSLAATRMRLQALSRRPGIAHALLFRNVGRAAGATREHVHSQLMGTAIAVPLVKQELEGARRFFDEHRQCVFCRMIDEERGLGQRVVCESRAYLALCPYASRFPYEMWILPKQHASHFESVAQEDLADLASLSRRAIAKIERLSQSSAYNLVFHSAPFDSLAIEHYHWHMEILPRMTIPAGFEWGSGCAVNPVSPEAAAGALREIES